MPRRGRPRKDITPIDREKTQLADDIVNQVKYNAKLSEEQIFYLRQTLEETFKCYDMEKQQVVKGEGTVKDINHEALESFLIAKRAEGRSKTTIYNYGNEIAKLFMIINKDYRDITAGDVRAYMDYRKQHDGIATSSVNNIRMYLMSFYKWAVIDERMLRNPIDKISAVKREKKVVETFTDEEVEKLRCACGSERDLAIVDMLSSSGMRVSELTGLNISDVNFESGEVKVFGKGSKERVCYLTGRAKIHLKWYLNSRIDDNPALFVSAKKPFTRLSKNGVEHILKELGSKSGIDVHTRVHPHKFRATLATNMINKGADIAEVQSLLGPCLILPHISRNWYMLTANCF